MNAVVLVAPGQVRQVRLPEPDFGPRDVLVQMRGLGLCGTDLAVYSGVRETPALPWVMGHEGVGEIVAVGSDVTERAVGDQVAIEPNYCCRNCRDCRAGFTSACRKRVAVGLDRPGLLAEFVAVPAAFTWPAPPTISLDDLVCVEPLTVARAAIRRSGADPTSRCLVVGAGSQGLLMIQALQAMGMTVFVQEPHQGRAQLAMALGAAPLSEYGDADVLFETSGAPEGLLTGLEHLRPGGTAVLVGISGEPLGLPSAALVYRQLTLRGSLIYDHPVDFPDTIQSIATREVRPGAVLQARYQLGDAAEAFAAVAAVPGKVWISFEG